METLHGCRQLIHEWKARGMEVDGYEGEAETGFQLQDYLLQLLRQRETRERRMARLFAVALLLLILGVVALLVMAGVERKCHASPDSQTEAQPDRHSSGTDGKREQVKLPRALLTAPHKDKPAGEYLQWEHDNGNAYCEEDFKYSNGELSVPRAGYYRLYLQLTYKGNDDNCTLMKLSFSLYLFGDDYPDNRALASSEDTVVCNENPWSKSLYTSVTFKLKANDRLRVKSNHEKYLSRSEELVFFGAELLPE